MKLCFLIFCEQRLGFLRWPSVGSDSWLSARRSHSAFPSCVVVSIVSNQLPESPVFVLEYFCFLRLKPFWCSPCLSMLYSPIAYIQSSIRLCNKEESTRRWLNFYAQSFSDPMKYLTPMRSFQEVDAKQESRSLRSGRKDERMSTVLGLDSPIGASPRTRIQAVNFPPGRGQHPCFKNRPHCLAQSNRVTTRHSCYSINQTLTELRKS